MPVTRPPSGRDGAWRGVTALGVAAWFVASLAVGPEAAAAAPARLELASPRADQGLVRTVRLRFEAINATAERVAGGRLLVYVPALETATQRLLWVDTSHPATLDRDPRGNAWVTVALPTVPPGGALRLSITAAVGVAAEPAPRPNREGRAALTPEPFVEVDDPAIAELAEGLRRQTPAATARAVYELVTAKLRPAAYEPRDLGAAHALRVGAGDCSEMSYAFVALARAAGLPSRVMGGWVVDASALLQPSRYHNWAEYYDGVTWRIADPLGRRLDQRASDYVATHIGGVEARGHHPLSGSHRFRADAAGLTLRMLGD